MIEEELRDIVSVQHGNVDRLVELVKENEIILNQMKVRFLNILRGHCCRKYSCACSFFSVCLQDNLRHRIVQDVIKIVMMSDKNNDGRCE